MATEILKSFGSLQSELEQAKDSLKGVDENIKKLIGRDPSEIYRQNLKRLNSDDSKYKSRSATSNRRIFNHENDEPPPTKRRSSVFNRLSERDKFDDELEQKAHKHIISKVIVTPKEVPSRQEALEAQNKDEKSKARNRRMFGALLGTLQKFQQEETKLKWKEEKRAQVEKKIEEIEIREKAEIKKERKELFMNRKRKQAEIRVIELKMGRMKDYAHWESVQKPRANFILTKAKPQIHYLPRKLNDANKTALAETRAEIEKLIDTKRQEVFNELQQIEDRMKRNFEPKSSQKEDSNDVNDDDEQDVDMKDDLNEAVDDDKSQHNEEEKENDNEATSDNLTHVSDAVKVEADGGAVVDSSSAATGPDSHLKEEKMQEAEADSTMDDAMDAQVEDTRTEQEEQNTEHD